LSIAGGGGSGLAHDVGSASSTTTPHSSTSGGGTSEVEFDRSDYPWKSWSDYEKVHTDGQYYAKIGDRLYSQHAVERLQPSGNRFGSSIFQIGGSSGRSIPPSYVEEIIRTVKPITQENGNLKYVKGTLEVITNVKGYVVTVITK